MIDTFKNSFRLKIAYRTNSIIHAVKGLPFIKKILPDSLYACEGLKTLVNVISVIYEIISVFLFKAIYFALFFVTPLELFNKTGEIYFVHIFLILSIIGTFLNTPLFQVTKDKYYAIFVMRMDTKKYVLSEYLYLLLKSFVGTFASVLVIGLIFKFNAAVILLLPIFVVAIKMTASALMLHFNFYEARHASSTKTSVIIFSLAFILLAAAYSGVYADILIPMPVFYILTVALIIGAYFALRYLFSYKKFRSLYKDMFSENGNPLITQDSGKIIQGSLLKKIDLDTKYSSNKKGCAYLNDIFIKRHRKMLTDSAMRFAYVIGAIVIILIVSLYIFPQFKKEINKLTLLELPTMAFIMYFVNRGNVITRCMFMNCDHSLLAYRFYRQPKIILSLFTARLKSLTFINFIPATVIAVGLPLLLLLSGGTNEPLNYLILFISIEAMSCFFSIHNLVMYYLLQPYNENFETKNLSYTIIQGATYFLCYFAMNKHISTILFGSLVTAFCVIYAVVALILAYRLAPKTFKLHQ